MSLEKAEVPLALVMTAGLMGIMLTGSVIGGIAIFLVGVALWVAWDYGWLERGARMVWARLVAQVKQLLDIWSAEEAPTNPWEAPLGRDAVGGVPIEEDVRDLGSMGVYALTRFGKTTMFLSLIHYLVQQHAPSELQMAIVDPEAFDYKIYQKLPHLWKPVARTREDADMLFRFLHEELDYRGNLFEQIPQDRMCNSLDRYHALNEELGLGLPRLPILLIIIDEMQDIVDAGSEAEDILIRVAKKGQKRGMLLWAGTQRPTSDVMTGHIKSQFTARLVGHMASPGDYYRVHEIPKEVWGNMQMAKGRFMFYFDGAWRHLQGRLVPDAELERIARRISRGRTPPTWQEISSEGLRPISKKRAWQGSVAEKRQMTMDFLMDYDEKPRPEDFMQTFDVASTQTARKWIDENWPRAAKAKGIPVD